MTMLNSPAKEITNVESKNENESEIQDKLQKYENFINFLFNIRKYYPNEIIMAHINIASLRNEFDMLRNSITEYIHILKIFETKLDDIFSHAFISSKKLFKSIYIRQIFS